MKKTYNNLGKKNTSITKEEIQKLFNTNFGENRYTVNRINTKINDGKKNRFFLEATCKHGTYIRQNMQESKKGIRPKKCTKCSRELDFLKKKQFYTEERNKAKSGLYKGWANITKIDNDSGFIYFDCDEHKTKEHRQLKRNFKLGELPSSCEDCKKISYLRKPHPIEFWDKKLRTGKSEIGRKFYIINPNLFHPKIERIPLICTHCDGYKFDVDRTNVGRHKSCDKCKEENKRKIGIARGKSDAQIIQELNEISEHIPENYIFLNRNRQRGKDTQIHIGCKSDKHIYKTFKRNIYQLNEFMCPHCYPRESIGSQSITQYLKSNDFSYEREVTFSDCKYIRKLRFDFVVHINKNTRVFIEFDGPQHFEMPKLWGDKDCWQVCFNRDKKKNEYVNKKAHSFILRIPHFKLYEISTILDRDLQILIQGGEIKYSSDKEVKEFYESHFSIQPIKTPLDYSTAQNLH